MRMNAHQAETAYGTPRMTIGRWIRNGKLPADGDGYFNEEDFKKLDAHRLTLSAPGRKTAAPAKKRTPRKRALAKKKAAPASKKKAVKKKPDKKAASSKDDALYQAAVEVCESTGYTVSNIQSRLRIGYNRANRLLDAILDGKPRPVVKLKKAKSAGGGGIGGPEPHEIHTPLMAGSRQEVDLRKALANAVKAEMEVKIKMKDLISRELVSRVFRKIYSIDATEWRGLGPRLAPDIMAVCEVEDPTKEVEVSDRVEQEVFRTLDHVKRVINEFLEEIESEDRIDDE